jgi:hypothetical protein
MKILNIDAFAQITRQISLGGVAYPIEETSVQQFIDNLKAAEALEATDPAAKENVAKNFEQAIASIKEAIPTLPEEKIRALKLPAMTAVLQFIRGELDLTETPGAAGESDAEKKPS